MKAICLGNSVELSNLFDDVSMAFCYSADIILFKLIQ